MFTFLQFRMTPSGTYMHVRHSHHTHAHLCFSGFSSCIPLSLSLSLSLSFSLLSLFFLSLLKLGRCTVPDSAHRVLIRPRSGRRAHGSFGSLQSGVRGGARCPALARQAAHPPGEWHSQIQTTPCLYFVWKEQCIVGIVMIVWYK